MLQAAAPYLAPHRSHQPADVEPSSAQHRMQRIALASPEPPALVYPAVVFGVPDGDPNRLASHEPALLFLAERRLLGRSLTTRFLRAGVRG